MTWCLGDQFQRTRAAGSLLQLSCVPDSHARIPPKKRGKQEDQTLVRHSPSWALHLPVYQVRWAVEPSLSLRLLSPAPLGQGICLPAETGHRTRGSPGPGSLSQAGGLPGASVAPAPPREERAGTAAAAPTPAPAAPPGCP